MSIGNMDKSAKDAVREVMQIAFSDLEPIKRCLLLHRFKGHFQRKQNRENVWLWIIPIVVDVHDRYQPCRSCREPVYRNKDLMRTEALCGRCAHDEQEREETP